VKVDSNAPQTCIPRDKSRHPGLVTVNCGARALLSVDARVTFSGSSMSPRLAPQRRCRGRLRKRVDPKETGIWSGDGDL